MKTSALLYNLIGVVLGLLVLNACFQQPGYSFVKKMLSSNYEVIKNHKDLDVEERYAIKLGIGYSAFKYVRENTPDSAVILLPRREDFMPENQKSRFGGEVYKIMSIMSWLTLPNASFSAFVYWHGFTLARPIQQGKSSSFWTKSSPFVLCQKIKRRSKNRKNKRKQAPAIKIHSNPPPRAISDSPRNAPQNIASTRRSPAENPVLQNSSQRTLVKRNTTGAMQATCRFPMDQPARPPGLPLSRPAPRAPRHHGRPRHPPLPPGPPRIAAFSAMNTFSPMTGPTPSILRIKAMADRIQDKTLREICGEARGRPGTPQKNSPRHPRRRARTGGMQPPPSPGKKKARDSSRALWAATTYSPAL